MRHSLTRPPVIPVLLAAVVLLAPAVFGAGQDAAPGREQFTAQAVSLGTIATGANTRVNILFTRWSTEDEREELRTALVEKGTEGLFDALTRMRPVGRIRRDTGGVGWELRYAHQMQSGGKRRIVFATDRPMSFAERRAQPRSIDYKFMVGELTVDASGKGEGKLAVAVKAQWDPSDKTLELENYDTEPVRLLEVRKL